jgi:hypothetical protein
MAGGVANDKARRLRTRHRGEQHNAYQGEEFSAIHISVL